jgi:hypothetical protein
MIFSVETWLLPAIAAGSSSYLVCLAWERLKHSTAPTSLQAAFLAALSFLMGAVCAYFRHVLFTPSPESSVIIMFGAGASSTFFWLLLRKYMFRYNGRNRL